jgi:SsrA-binding protein
MKVVATNKFAHFNYFLLETFEAGIALRGSEIKSVRQNGMTLNESFILLSKSGVLLKNCFIKPYQTITGFSPDPRRDRELLLNKIEIQKLRENIEKQGLTIIPVKAYFKDEKLKIEIALARGKKLFNKKEDLKERDIKREQERRYLSK